MSHHSIVKNDKQKNDDKHTLDIAFNTTIKRVKKGIPKSGLENLDLSNAIIKYRKTAILHFMPLYIEHFKEDYDVDQIKKVLLAQCCEVGQPIDDIEEEYHFVFAAALWILDALRHSDNLQTAIQYLTTDGYRLQQIQLPEYTEPFYTEGLVRSMIDLILSRNESNQPNHWFLNQVSAERLLTKQQYRTANHTPSHDMSPREKFDAVISLIPVSLIERAVRNYQEKFWEFQDVLAREVDDSFQMEKDCKRKSNRFARECDEKAKRVLNDLSIPANETALLVKNPNYSFGLNALKEPPVDMGEFFNEAVNGLAYEDAAHSAKIRASLLLYDAHHFFLDYLDESLLEFSDKDINTFRSISVDDPYETAFAYIYLLDSGSELPWLYNPCHAVLKMAIRKLPWTAFTGRSSYTKSMEDLVGDDFAFFGKGPTENLDIDSYLNTISDEDLDDELTRTSGLYDIKYKNQILYDPELPPAEDYLLNLPQIVYGLTGMIMPRNGHSFNGFSKRLKKCKMTDKAAKFMELYLQLALDCQQPIDPIREIREVQIQDPEQSEKIKEAEQKIKELESSLYQSEKKTKIIEEKYDTLHSTYEEEKQELASLRELVYLQSNEHGDDQYSTVEQEIEFPYKTKKRIAVFGGHDSWLKVIRPMLPSVTFVPKDQTPNADMIRNQDVIWIQANSLGHKDFYKIINVIRTYHIPVRYFGFASARKCALQLVENDK